MMQIIDLRAKQNLSPAELKKVMPRASLDATAAIAQVLPLITEVKEQGATALDKHALKFDGVTGHDLKVSESVILAAYESADQSLIDSLKVMISRVRAASEAQVPPAKSTEITPGGFVNQRWQAVKRVGLYVPGGKAVYPSSVVMNVVSAQVAGVEQIAIASPVQKESSSVHPTILTAAYLLGIKDVYAIGGASAIASFAYGVEEIGLNPVDVVTGPGNIFVAAAKRALQGVIGIDSEAGTTEILIVADEQASAKNVAADLLSQAEHDEAAASILVTNSELLAERVQTELVNQVLATEHQQRAQTALTGQQSAIILVDSLDHAVEVSNAYAPEHLSVQTENAYNLVPSLTEAGAIFVGPYSPVSLGDYIAGSNHVLPTGGTARFSAGLGAHTFLRAQQVVSYSKQALLESNDNLTVLATAERLPAHAAAVHVRFEEQ